MKKEIRLLIEGFFDDDLFNLKEDINQDILDIGNYNYNYTYQITDIYYKNNNPYAICCGEAKLFNDKLPRFLIINKMSRISKSWKKREINYIYKQHNDIKEYTITSILDIIHIDENGYENTLNILNNFDISDFPAFKYCIDIDNNAYLPAIDELELFYFNFFKYFINDKSTLNKILGHNSAYLWSSTEYNNLYAVYCEYYSLKFSISYYNKHIDIANALPFLYIN